MRKLIAIIGALIAGGLGISLIPQAANAALSSN
jgi:hypothetical protein